MFWGLILKANKKYTQALEKPFNLTKASLDYYHADDEPVQVMYSDGKSTYLLCTLQKSKKLQCSLNLNFNEGDTLCFSTKGNGIVHLTGFLIPEDEFDPMMGDMDDDSEDVSDEEEDETEVPDLREKLLKKKKEKEKVGKKDQQKKKAPVEEESSDESDVEEAQNGDKSLDSSAAVEEDSDDDDDLEEEEDSDDDDESMGDEEESEAEDDSEEEEVQMPTKKQKLDPQAAKKKQNGLENGQKTEKTDKKDKQKEQPQSKKDKPQQPQAAAANNPVKKLQGGLLALDIKVGNGAEAKPGKKLQVYYEGRLKSNNKVFDSTKSGPGFKMTLGRGEVIKAWDIGLIGMKVGGKRLLTCPPGLAYGAKGNPPVIPANSTLVFEVELKNVL